MSQLLVAQRALTVPGWAKDALWRNARAVPSLDLRFADNKSLVDAATGASLITFTRASSGTYVGSDGVLQTAATDVPRFDHNPTTRESLGLLVEEQRTNLLLRSEEFDNVTWGALNVTVSANTQVAPDGVTSADTITDVNGVTSANVGCFQSTTLADSTTYAMSCYVKAGTKTTCRVGIRDKVGTTISANFNLTTASTTVGNAVSSTIQDAGNGWYRCTAICASLTGATSPRGLVFMDTGSYTANGTGTIHVYGADLQAGAFPTSYIPTTSATVTRAADVASITGAAFTSFYNQTEGTVFADLVTSSRGHNSYPRIVAFLDSDINNGNEASIYTRNIGTAEDYRLFGVYSDGVGSAADFNPGSGAPLGSGRVAMAIKNNDGGYCVNGATPLSDTSCTRPAPIQLRLFGQARFQPASSGYIKRLTYWPQALPSRLQALTQ